MQIIPYILISYGSNQLVDLNSALPPVVFALRNSPSSFSANAYGSKCIVILRCGVIKACERRPRDCVTSNPQTGN